MSDPRSQNDELGQTSARTAWARAICCTPFVSFSTPTYRTQRDASAEDIHDGAQGPSGPGLSGGGEVVIEVELSGFDEDVEAVSILSGALVDVATPKRARVRLPGLRRVRHRPGDDRARAEAPWTADDFHSQPVRDAVYGRKERLAPAPLHDVRGPRRWSLAIHHQGARRRHRRASGPRPARHARCRQRTPRPVPAHPRHPPPNLDRWRDRYHAISELAPGAREPATCGPGRLLLQHRWTRPVRRRDHPDRCHPPQPWCPLPRQPHRWPHHPNEVLAGAPGSASRVSVFLCGPTPMVKGLAQGLRKAGVPSRNIYREHFDWR